MIAVIRIAGMVKVNGKIQETLNRLRLRRKYVCVVIKSNEVNLGMLKKIRNEVAYGKIDEDTLKKLIDKRGQKIDKNEKISEVKDLEFEKANLKPFFRLHPPRKGINSKQHFPKGVLGNHKEHIKDLIERML